MMDRQLSSTMDPIFRDFDVLLRGMRRQFFGKQIALACVTGCTDAAVSYWESGKRAPDPRRFSLLVAALAEAGAPAPDLQHLRLAWERAKVKPLR